MSIPNSGDPGDYFDRSMQNAYNLYLDGVSAVVQSLDIPVGLTPKKTIWQLNKSKLYHYLPTRPKEERYPVPLLLVYALINKPFIFDLPPDEVLSNLCSIRDSTCISWTGVLRGQKTKTPPSTITSPNTSGVPSVK